MGVKLLPAAGGSPAQRSRSGTHLLASMPGRRRPLYGAALCLAMCGLCLVQMYTMVPSPVDGLRSGVQVRQRPHQPTTARLPPRQ